MTHLLDIHNLSVAYRGPGATRTVAVDEVSLTLDKGQSLGLVGESGSGKSTIGAAIMGLLAPNSEVTGGQIHFNGEDLLKADPQQLRQVRWKQISMIFQAAMNALNPIQRVGRQIVEAIRVHEPQTSPEDALARVQSLFKEMDIPLARLNHFPHQYSGGMRQRAIIAMALACNPQLVIADEPTTALDVIVQDQILKTIMALQKELSIGIVFISHDIAVVADVCHHVAVMYAGQIVETGPGAQVFSTPGHPYTRMLLDAHITLADQRRRVIPSDVSGFHGVEKSGGCRFAARCRMATADCRMASPQWIRRSGNHWVRCTMATEETPCPPKP